MSSRKLTAKQEAYKNNRIAGMGVCESYNAAYPDQNMSQKAVSVAANKLEKDPRISLEVNAKRKQATERALITTEDLVKMLLVEAQNIEDGAHTGRGCLLSSCSLTSLVGLITTGRRCITLISR